MGKKLLIVLVVVLLLVIAVGGFVLYRYVLNPKEEVSLGVMYPVPGTFMTDLSGGSHIRVEVHFELDDKKLAEEATLRKAQVTDAIYSILRSKTRSELSGAEGQRKLALEIKDTLNALFTTGQLLRVYFLQIVID